MRLSVLKKHDAAFVFLVLILSLTLTACSTNKTTSKDNGEEWLESANLKADETVDELYEKAKEEGKVVVYSQSSRISAIKASFEEKYPGVTVEGYDMDTGEIIEKIIREQEAGIFNADVAFIKDTSGSVSGEILPKGLVHPYMPKDITEQMVEPYKSTNLGLAPYVSLRVLYYNTEAYKEPPVTNYWDLTEPKWKGKILLGDPMQNADDLDHYLTMIQNSDEMAESYKEKFGKEIELNGTENAGYEFFKRILENDPIFMKSSGEIVEAIGKPGQNDPPVGISASSKQRELDQKALNAAVIYDLKPRLSNAQPSYLYMVNKAPHTNAGKLFIRWVAGEADGSGKGIEPFNVIGSWVTRPDIARKDQQPLDSLNIWDYDGEFVYKNAAKFREFWMKNQ